MPSAVEARKGHVIPLEQELEIVVCSYMDAGNQTRVLLQEQQVLLAAEQSLHPQDLCFRISTQKHFVPGRPASLRLVSSLLWLSG